MKKIVLASLLSSAVFAGGYKLPESSLNAVALGAANVAHTKSADSAYYNPANMVFLSDEQRVELALTYIGLSELDYDGKYKGVDGSTHSQKEDFLIPTLHYVSPSVDGARYGFSIVVPAGLSKRWHSQPAKSVAEEFTLETVELNPSVALPVGDRVGIAIGVRALYSKGYVKASKQGAFSQDMEGDSIDFGYNLALSYKPTKSLELALTYRSKIDMQIEGDADLYYNPAVVKDNYSASVELPLPALFNAAVAYTFATKTTIEFVYERNYWHSYSELDFNYSDASAEAVFGRVKDKSWEDTNTFRFGITQELDRFTLMGGLVIDESPIPEKTLGYELPDADSTSFSLGARYAVSKKLEIGMAALYSIREDRVVHNDKYDGEFTDSTALLVSVGLEYKF
jgi:long-chain fatty acid transport protein